MLTTSLDSFWCIIIKQFFSIQLVVELCFHGLNISLLFFCVACRISPIEINQTRGLYVCKENYCEWVIRFRNRTFESEQKKKRFELCHKLERNIKITMYNCRFKMHKKCTICMCWPIRSSIFATLYQLISCISI